MAYCPGMSHLWLTKSKGPALLVVFVKGRCHTPGQSILDALTGCQTCLRFPSSTGPGMIHVKAGRWYTSCINVSWELIEHGSLCTLTGMLQHMSGQNFTCTLMEP